MWFVCARSLLQGVVTWLTALSLYTQAAQLRLCVDILLCCPGAPAVCVHCVCCAVLNYCQAQCKALNAAQHCSGYIYLPHMHACFFDNALADRKSHTHQSKMMLRCAAARRWLRTSSSVAARPVPQAGSASTSASVVSSNQVSAAGQTLSATALLKGENRGLPPGVQRLVDVYHTVPVERTRCFSIIAHIDHG